MSKHGDETDLELRGEQGEEQEEEEQAATSVPGISLRGCH